MGVNKLRMESANSRAEAAINFCQRNKTVGSYIEVASLFSRLMLVHREISHQLAQDKCLSLLMAFAPIAKQQALQYAMFVIEAFTYLSFIVTKVMSRFPKFRALLMSNATTNDVSYYRCQLLVI